MLRIKWIGINGFEIVYNNKMILIDPYVTRNSKIVCDPSAVSEYIKKADYIFIGHSHWDHLADTAEIVRQTGAVVIGSKTTANICRAQHVPESKIIEVKSGEILKHDTFRVRIIKSCHKKPCLYEGYYEMVPNGISTIEDFLEGGTSALLFQFGDIKILNIGSAGFIEKELRGIGCDLLLLGIAGRTAHFVKELFTCIHAEVVIPTHFDYFETPMKNPGDRIGLDAFVREVNAVTPETEIMIPRILEYIDLNRQFKQT